MFTGHLERGTCLPLRRVTPCNSGQLTPDNRTYFWIIVYNLQWVGPIHRIYFSYQAILIVFLRNAGLFIWVQLKLDESGFQRGQRQTTLNRRSTLLKSQVNLCTWSDGCSDNVEKLFPECLKGGVRVKGENWERMLLRPGQSEKVLEGGGSFGLESCDDIVHSTCLSKQGQLTLKHSRTTSTRVRRSSKWLSKDQRYHY